MPLQRRHKYILLALGFYWPLIFLLTHIPVPNLVGKLGMSDKTMHVLAYMVLMFFMWSAARPYERVRWNRPTVWILLAVVVFYGVADEVLQGYVHRSPDVTDFLADLSGALAALITLTFLSFWPALLSLSVVFIFAVSNLSGILQSYPAYHLETAFYFVAYTAVTLIWIQHLYRRGLPAASAGRLLMAALFPLGLLVSIKISGAAFFHKPFNWIDVSTAVFGIAAAVLVSRLTLSLGPSKQTADR